MNIEFKICTTLDEFNTLRDAGEIQDSWVVLIEDQPALWTNGKLLPSPYTKEQLESLFVTIASKGIANGIASLNENGKIPESLLPSYVDDVLEFENLAAFPTVGESGKIYVAIDTNLSYRWSGSIYVLIGPSSIMLGGDAYILGGTNNVYEEADPSINGSNLFINSSNNTVGYYGYSSIVCGNGNRVGNGHDLIIGNDNVVDGHHSIVSGSGNYTNGSCTSALGERLIATGMCGLAIGRFNAEGTLNRFVVGIGKDDDSRKNAFAILQSGDIYFGNETADKVNRFYDATTKKINESFLPDSVPTSTGFTNMQVVSALPENPDANTLYIVTA